MNNESEKEIRIITNALLKAIIVICLCVAGTITLKSCELDSDVVADCRDACESSTTQMQSVTPYKCICIDKTTTSSPWVLN